MMTDNRDDIKAKRIPQPLRNRTSPPRKAERSIPPCAWLRVELGAALSRPQAVIARTKSARARLRRRAWR